MGMLIDCPSQPRDERPFCMFGGKARRSAKPALFPIANMLDQTGACQPYRHILASARCDDEHSPLRRCSLGARPLVRGRSTRPRQPPTRVNTRGTGQRSAAAEADCLARMETRMLPRSCTARPTCTLPLTPAPAPKLPCGIISLERAMKNLLKGSWIEFVDRVRNAGS